MLIGAVIPVHNEAQALGAVVRGVREHLSHVLVVDDGSTDDSGLVARQAGAQLIVLPRRRGKGAALRVGLRALWAQGLAAVVTLDGDGQHQPGEIPRFLSAWRDGADLVLGDRSNGFAAMPLLRRCANRLMTRALRPWIDPEIRDSQCGFRLIDARLASRLKLDSHHFDFESELLIRAMRARARLAHVPVSVIYGQERSKIRVVPDTWRFLRLILRQERAVT